MVVNFFKRLKTRISHKDTEVDIDCFSLLIDPRMLIYKMNLLTPRVTFKPGLKNWNLESIYTDFLSLCASVAQIYYWSKNPCSCIQSS